MSINAQSIERRRVMTQKLTEAQLRELRRIVEQGFVEHSVAFGKSQANRPRWHLVGLGLASFDFGPPKSFLKVQGFMPTEAGRDAVAKATAT